jgi:glycosyltransferase involved in cell wall biosynthesis
MPQDVRKSAHAGRNDVLAPADLLPRLSDMSGVKSPGPHTRVLFVSSAEHPGADTFIHMLIMRTLDRARFDVHVACSACPPDARTKGYNALAAIPDIHLRESDFGPTLDGLSLAGKALRAIRLVPTAFGLLSLARYIRSQGITIIHSTDRPRDAVACVILGKMTGAKSIVHAHLKCAEWLSGSIRWAMSQADALIGVSGFVAKSLVDYRYDRTKVHAVLNAIDLPVWDYRLDGTAVRESLRIPTGAPVIACAARLFRSKGQAETVRAVASLRTEFPDVRLLIIGADDRQAMKESFTEELTKLASDLGAADNVIFMGQRSDMPLVMAASDIFALPSDEEPFGLVFTEAMAMQKPVVALANGGTLEIVEHGKSGLLSAPGDVDGLAANLGTLLRRPVLRAQMGAYGRRQVEARFTATRMAADVAQVYASVASAANAGAVALHSQTTP